MAVSRYKNTHQVHIIFDQAYGIYAISRRKIFKPGLEDSLRLLLSL